MYAPDKEGDHLIVSDDGLHPDVHQSHSPKVEIEAKSIAIILKTRANQKKTCETTHKNPKKNNQ